MMKLKYQEKFGPFISRDFCSKLAVWFFRNRRGGQIIYNMVRQVTHNITFKIYIMHKIFQAEAVFNLSQLMFALYHGAPEASTFRDLNDQLRQVS